MLEETDSNITARSTIFLVEEDDDARPGLTSHLRQLGYRLLVAADLEDAHEWMSGEGIIPADLVLINLVGRTPEESVMLGRRLREHSKYDGVTPLVVMAEKYGREVEGTDVNVEGNDWVMYPGEETRQWERLLARLLDGHPRSVCNTTPSPAESTGLFSCGLSKACSPLRPLCASPRGLRRSMHFNRIGI